MSRFNKYILILLLVLVAGCAKQVQVQYLPAEEKVVHLKKGEPAPFEGFLLSPSTLATLYEKARVNIEEHQ